MEFEKDIWGNETESLYTGEPDKSLQNITIDESTSVASLGSFGSASWVAGHFIEEESGGEPTDHVDWIPEIQSDKKGKSTSTENLYSVSISLHEDSRGQSPETKLAGRGFRCPHCCKAFTRRSEMGRHVGVSIIRILRLLIIWRVVHYFQPPPARVFLALTMTV